MRHYRKRSITAAVPPSTHLVGVAALVRAKHDGVGGVVLEALGLEAAVGGEELEVGAAAGEAVGQLELILQDQTLGRVNRLGQQPADAVVLGLLRDLQSAGQDDGDGFRGEGEGWRREAGDRQRARLAAGIGRQRRRRRDSAASKPAPAAGRRGLPIRQLRFQGASGCAAAADHASASDGLEVPRPSLSSP